MKKEVSTLVVEALSSIVPVLSLRGTDEFAREGGDLDFMVPPGKALVACRRVALVAIQKGWFLTLFRDIGYLAQIVLVRPKEDGADDAIKIDFFDGLRWYGVGNDVAGQKLFYDILPHCASEERLSGAAGFFQKILTVGQASERDWARVIASGADATYLTAIAQDLGLPVTTADFERHGVTGIAKWRLRAASGGVLSQFSGIIWFIRAVAVHIRFKMGVGTEAGIAICVSGLDSPSRRKLLGRFLAAHYTAGGEQPKLVYFLPSWIPILGESDKCHKSGISCCSSYSKFSLLSNVKSTLRLMYYISVFSVAKIVVWISVKRGNQTLLDGSFLDFSVNPSQFLIPKYKLPYWLVSLLIPSGCVFFIDASLDVRLDRNREPSLDKPDLLQRAYHPTCVISGITFLNDDEATDTAFCEFISHISYEYVSRIEAAQVDIEQPGLS